METLLQDLRYSFRMLRGRPGFSVAALLALALGIGVNSVIFSAVNAILLRQLPFKASEQLVWVWSTRTDRDKAFFSIPNFIDSRDQNQTLEQMVAFANWGANLAGKGEPERLQGVRISANAFQVLGVEATAGRLLIPEDDRPDSPRVVVLGHGLWQRRFGGDENLIGQTLSLNGQTYTVVGILPPGFKFFGAEGDAEIGVPLKMEIDSRKAERGSNFLRVYARLKPGVTRQQAQADLAAIEERLRQQYPDTNAKNTAPRVLALQTEIVGNYGLALWLLLGAVAVVLLIACTNLANLLLARAATRRKEMAIRTALGATRARLIRQMLTESLLLALCGGVLGLLFAWWGIDLLLGFSPADLPRLNAITIDARVLLFTLAVSLVAGIVFGLAPAIQSSRTNLNEELKSNLSSVFGGARQNSFRNLLVVAEVALSLLLLIGAGLFVRSLIRLQQVSPGLDTQNLLLVRLSLPQSNYTKGETVTAFYEKLEPRVSSLPGVEAVAASNVLPLSGLNVRADFTIVGRPPRTREETPAAQNRWVSPGYFNAMKIPVLQGREFTEQDRAGARLVAVVDKVAARRYWQDENPVGAHILIDDAAPAPPREVEIIGVVDEIKHNGLDEEPTATVYAPFYQIPPGAVSFFANRMNLVVRTSIEPMTLGDEIRSQVQSVDRDVPASNISTMEQFLAATIAPRKFNLFLLVIFAVAALMLAAAGLYAVIAYSVQQRTKEIGIRMALGAKANDVFKLIISQGMKLVVIGVATGLLASLLLTRLMASLLYGVSATDPLTFATIALLLTGVALGACFVPARRATKVDPMVALRYE